MRTVAKTAAALAVVSTFGACGPTMYAKPGATQADFGRIMARCEYEAASNVQAPDYSLRTDFGREVEMAMRKQKLIGLCLQADGWAPVKS